MITKLSHATLFVRDQAKAYDVVREQTWLFGQDGYDDGQRVPVADRCAAKTAGYGDCFGGTERADVF